VERLDIQQYLDLIPSQHYGQPDFMEWISVALGPVGNNIDLLNQFIIAFGLDDAEGVQLDVLGEYVGVSRLLPFQPESGDSPILQDDLYRALIKTKIVKNFWDGTIPQVHILWAIIFPDNVLIIQDNQDMSMNLIVIGVESDLEKELIIRGYIAPKPAGVRVNYIFPDGRVFAYDRDNEAFAGYDEGTWLRVG
jgi:hypothetical protein